MFSHSPEPLCFPRLKFWSDFVFSKKPRRTGNHDQEQRTRADEEG